MVPGQPDSEVKRLLHFVVVGGGPTGKYKWLCLLKIFIFSWVFGLTI